MIGFDNHYTKKIKMGFHRFCRQAKCCPCFLDGKVGTVMIGFDNHYTINRQWMPYFSNSILIFYNEL